MSVFAAKGDARDYLLMASATFLVFLSHSTVSFLAVILRDLGMGEASIGVVISAPLVPMLAGMFLSGYFMEQLGPLRVVRAGFFMILLAHLTLQFTVGDFAGTYFSRAFHGFGYGIFQPAGMTYVMGKLRPERMVHPFGIYASMVLLPHIAGPWLMENLYASIGLRGLFLVTAVPSVLGNLLAQLPGAGEIRKATKERTSYSELLRMVSIRPLIMAIFIVGMVYGIVPTIMALYLKMNAIAMVYYFTPFTAALFTGRFVVIRLLDRFPRKALVTAGFLLMGISHLWLISFRTPSAAILAGIVLGLGYSLEYPSLSVWISARFDPSDRGKPVALLNILFHAGIFITPLIGGWVTEKFSLGTYLGGLIALALVAAVSMRWVKEAG
jgi:MFS family permease